MKMKAAVFALLLIFISGCRMAHTKTGSGHYTHGARDRTVIGKPRVIRAGVSDSYNRCRLFGQI
jgi:hypothetical protein